MGERDDFLCSSFSMHHACVFHLVKLNLLLMKFFICIVECMSARLVTRKQTRRLFCCVQILIKKLLKMQKRHSVEYNFSNFLGMHGSSMPRASGNNCKIKNQHCSTSPANVTLKAVQITIWQIFIKITRLKLRINTNCFKHYYSVTNFNSHLGLSGTPFVAVSKEFPLLLVSYLC